jgi:hypothetical protein
MNIININGRSFSVSGNNIVVKNNSVYVDGSLVEDGLSGIVKIEFTGDLASLDCNTVEVNGNVQGNVKGNTIKCGDVGGNVDGNTVKCENVSGNVKGNTVKHR